MLACSLTYPCSALSSQPLIPTQAGIQPGPVLKLDPRLRGDERI